MKHSFKNPQKKGKIYISYPKNKIIIELNEIKIKNFNELNDKNGYFLECNIPIINNKEMINKIKEIDNDGYNCLKENYEEWFVDNDNDGNKIDNIFLKSYEDDMPMTLILSNKIEMDIIIDDEEKEIYDLINYIQMNKKNKNYLINIDIVLLGLYINKTSIINKWAIKYINIESINENENNNIEWYKNELEDEWRYDIIKYEKETKEKIEKMEERIKKVKELYEEIKIEKNIKIWETKIEKLKSIIFTK